MRRFVNPGKRIASFTRTFARLRWALGFDGIGIRGQLAQRAINPDGDIAIEWYQLSTSGGHIVSQCDSSTLGQRELMLRWNTGKLDFQIGGSPVIALSDNVSIADGKWNITYINTTVSVYHNDVLKFTINRARGIGRESAAPTRIGVRNNGGNFVEFFQGALYNVKINGVRWPMADRNQAIQLPQPSGLGDELITQSVLENPFFKGSQWTYLGGGRWRYVGDGSINELRFITDSEQPSAGYLEFEVESISGSMRCANNAVENPVNPAFNSVGVFRYFYTQKSNPSGFTGNSVVFLRNFGVASCIIKNISFKPLGTCNPMTISNATSTNWMQVVDDYVARFRKVLRFNGVGARGALAQRVINPDGDNTLEFYSVENSATIIAQNLSETESAREFQLWQGSSMELNLTFGGSTTNLCSPAQGYITGRKYFLTLTGTSFTLARDSQQNIIRSGTFIKGAVREPSAITSIMCRSGGVEAFYVFARGIQRDIKINGTLWPIADSAQSIQLPEPSGLGAELITQSVLENPAVKGWQWTYLGNGRWQYIGDGSYNELNFISTSLQPQSGFLEFEVESIIGSMRCFTATSSIGIQQSEPRFNTTGKKRWFVKDRDSISTGQAMVFVRDGAGTIASCIIKNISFKPLGTCIPLTLANVTSANWEDLEI